jgi:iron complex outermembrane recepter protein
MRQTARANRLTVAALGALALLPATIAIGQAPPGEPPSLQPLSTALEAVCREAGLQLVYSSYLGKGLMTQGPPPGKSFADSMAELLHDTGLTYEFVNDHTVTIVQVKKDVAVATAEPEREGSAQGPQAPARGDAARKAFSIENLLTQVVVTGTHISGMQPVGGHLIKLTRKDIDRSGYATVHDVIRTLPQNFNGGASEDYRGTGLEGINNSTYATGLNLRGLGSGSTLVLLNGRRLAPGAADGRFVDVSSIPLSAIERVEVLPDGASAIYGADAVGGVVNLILRSDYEGAETTGHYGSAVRGPSESQISQTIGTRWSSGSVILSTEYYARGALSASDREQTASSDLTRFGGDNFDQLEGSPGTLTDFINTWAIPRGQNGRSLTTSDLAPGTINLHNRNSGRDWLPEHDRWSVVSSLRQKIADRLDVFSDVLFAQRKTGIWNQPQYQLLFVPNTNAFYVNPNGGKEPVGVYYGFDDDLGLERDDALISSTNIATGLTYSLAGSWKATATLNYSAYGDETHIGPVINQDALNAALADSNPETAFNPFGDGSNTNPATLASIRQNAFVDRNLDARSISFAADGPFFNGLIHGMRLAAGGDYSEQALSSGLLFGDVVSANEHLSRRIAATYVELMVPLVDENKRLPWLHKLQLSLAGRRESYSDFGSATTPRFGLSWLPSDAVAFRGTWSKSFKAPDLLDRVESNNGIQINRQTFAGSATDVLIWYGPGNKDLQDENSTAWTFGTELNFPEQGVSAELTYFRIDFRDRVERVDFTTTFLDDPAFADLVTFNPSPELRADACSRAKFVGSLSDCLNAPVTALVDIRVNNVAALRTSGIDASGKYSFANWLGNFDLGLSATYLTDYSQARFQKSPLQNLLSTTGNPIDLRMRSSLAWTRGGMGAAAFFNYTNGYRDIVSKPTRRVGSWTTIDLQLSYTTPSTDNDLLANTSLSLSAENLLNKNPPFVNNPEGIGYDNANADLLGRFISFRLRKAW